MLKQWNFHSLEDQNMVQTFCLEASQFLHQTPTPPNHSYAGRRCACRQTVVSRKATSCQAAFSADASLSSSKRSPKRKHTESGP